MVQWGGWGGTELDLPREGGPPLGLCRTGRTQSLALPQPPHSRGNGLPTVLCGYYQNQAGGAEIRQQRYEAIQVKVSSRRS